MTDFILVSFFLAIFQWIAAIITSFFTISE